MSRFSSENHSVPDHLPTEDVKERSPSTVFEDKGKVISVNSEELTKRVSCPSAESNQFVVLNDMADEHSIHLNGHADTNHRQHDPSSTEVNGDNGVFPARFPAGANRDTSTPVTASDTATDHLLQTIDEVIAESRMLAEAEEAVQPRLNNHKDPGGSRGRAKSERLATSASSSLSQPSDQSGSLSSSLSQKSDSALNSGSGLISNGDSGSITSQLSDSQQIKKEPRKFSIFSSVLGKRKRARNSSSSAEGESSSKKRSVPSTTGINPRPTSGLNGVKNEPSTIMNDAKVNEKPSSSGRNSKNAKRKADSGKLSSLLKKPKVDAAAKGAAANRPDRSCKKRTPSTESKPTRKRNSRNKDVWSWKGKPVPRLIYSETEKKNIKRMCYPAVEHVEGEVIEVGDCVLLRPAVKGLKPHLGKVAALWEDEHGEKKISTFWYWRREEVNPSALASDPSLSDMEVFISNLKDENFVNSIEEKCFVVTLREFASYVADNKENNLIYRRPKEIIVPDVETPFDAVVPDKTEEPDIVYFTNRGYDGKTKRFWGFYFRGTKLKRYPLRTW